MSLAPLELVAAHPWQRVTFTTYALSLSFFESVVLDGLIRGGSSSALILADVEGVRGSLGEQGAQRVGKDYEVEPVAVSGGVFHAKISAFASADECHLLVGSGNLTFGGWGGNCEVLEHLHPEFAADAIIDAAEFFDLLRASSRVRQRADAPCAQLADDLRRAAQGKPRRGDVRLLHSLRESISEQIARAASDLGGATRLVAAAPFWDGGAALDTLAGALGLHEVFVHAHPSGVVEGLPGSDWPRNARTRIGAVSVAVLEAEGRRLHAKAFEVQCRRGRLVVSGSANGSSAALGARRNVEVCVMRVQREPVVGWTYRLTEVPDGRAAETTATADDDDRFGILRAVLEGDELVGEVLTPRMHGLVSLFELTPAGAEPLGEATLSVDGGFRTRARGLEERAWRGGRLVVRVVHPDGRRAEGFVSVAIAASITQRAGIVVRRLQAMLGGTETPEDVAAIMSWFHEDPRRLGVELHATGRGPESDARRDEDRVVPVAALRERYANALPDNPGDIPTADAGWQRFMSYVLGAFRMRRGPLVTSGAGSVRRNDEDEPDASITTEAGDDAASGAADDSPDRRARAKSLEAFRALFAILTRPEVPTRHLLTAFDLTQYVCERLQPDEQLAKEWLKRLIDRLCDAGVPAGRREDVVASAVILAASAPGRELLRWARMRLLQLGVDLMSQAPSLEGAGGFRSILPHRMPVRELWVELRAVRTYPEQVRAYLRALERRAPSDGYPDLPDAGRAEWRILEEAIASDRARRRIVLTERGSSVCPACRMVLPTSERLKLHSTGIATATQCCGRIVIVSEE